jgi:hypothetical protein
MTARRAAFQAVRIAAFAALELDASNLTAPPLAPTSAPD